MHCYALCIRVFNPLIYLLEIFRINLVTIPKQKCYASFIDMLSLTHRIRQVLIDWNDITSYEIEFLTGTLIYILSKYIVCQIASYIAETIPTSITHQKNMFACPRIFECIIIARIPDY